MILPLLLLNSCTEDIPSTLKGTKWKSSLSGQEAWDMSGQSEPLPAGTTISANLGLNFISSSSVTMTVAATVKVGTQSASNSDEFPMTYVYDNATGKETLTSEGGDIEGTVLKNKLTLSDGTQTIVFTKK